MRKRQLLSSIGVLVMVTSLLAGCGGKTTESKPQETTTPVAETTAPDPVKETTEEATTDFLGYKLLWKDEFDGTALDESKWSYDPHEPGWTNNELQEYTTSTDNVFLRDGKLVLKAIKSEKNGKDYYTSGKIKGQNKTDFQYGKVVVSAKVPEGQGLWPAIWMMPKDESFYGQWPKCGEIDIMEVLGNEVTKSYSTIHYGEPHGEQQGTITLDKGSFADSFHQYIVEWEPGEMRFYTDGQLVLTANEWFTAVDGEDEKPYPAPFNQPFFVQLNLAVGGNWPGNPDETTNFDKAEFEIDYVRVYQKSEYNMNVTKKAIEFREPDDSGNYIHNGDFSVVEPLDDENADWSFLLFNGGEGAAEIKDNTLIITSTNAGTEEYSVQIVQPGLTMKKGHKYKLTFDAKADAPRDMITCVSAPTAGWIRYLQDTTFDLTTDFKTYTFDFTVNAKDDNNGRLEFNMGKHNFTDTVYIKNVRLEEVK